MITFSLQSGSNGNSIYVEAGGVRLLFDAGISGRQAELRMNRHGRSLRDCTALIISHDHSDHTACAGVLARRFSLPVYIGPRVHQAVQRKVGPLRDVRGYSPGDTLEIGSVRVHTIRTPHDGIDTACFVIEHEGRRLGIFTDLGRPFDELTAALREVDAAYLESNYDPEMLRTGHYPPELKRRIAGDGGHLSNDEAADLTRRSVQPRLAWLAVAHLSQENNRPELALASHRREVGALLPLFVASRYEVGELLTV